VSDMPVPRDNPGSNPSTRTRAGTERAKAHHGRRQSSTPRRYRGRGTMGGMSSIQGLGDAECRSDHGDQVLQFHGAVRNDECVPRFGGSTNQFLAIKGQVRAEDVEGETPLLQPAPALGGHRLICVQALPANYDPTNDHPSLHPLPQEIH
jgi:hypothetical protein